ncbi:hypothetical protein H5U35_10670, partial [Candidatus Aerophobetes bacterium]|nr:hypothetical protein [Candidatus Aerophobetes bacterium]
MRKKSFFLAVFLFSVFLFLQGACFSFQDDNFSLSLWETAKEILYPELNFFKEDTLFSTSSLFSSRGLINLSLPGKTQLTVRGRKVIGIKYMRYNYFSPGAREEKPLSSIEIEQKLQVQARGKIGDKIQVNLDYDDSLSKSEQQKISLVYRGYEDEIIQEIALGDITLALPKTHFTSYSKSLFGARMRAKWQDFYLTGIASVTKGISETKTFTGKTTTEEREIADVSFIKRTYFKFFFDQDYPPPDTFSYTPGSLEVWIDDQDGTNNISGQTVELTVLGEGGESYQGYFDRAYPGEDFTVDYVKGVLKFKEAVKEQCIVAVRYKDKDGNYHPDPGSGYSYRMI